MRLVAAVVLLPAAFGFLVADGQARAPSFVRGAVYRGSSRDGKVRIQVEAGGKTAGVDMGMKARCTGARHYTFPFAANFHVNPARIHGSSMSVTEVDHNLPRIGPIPAARVLRQAFVAHATGSGRTLTGTYKATATLTDGRSCTTGRVQFAAAVR